MCISQTVRGPLRPWCRELMAERGGRLPQAQTLGVVAHVHLLPIEDQLQLLRERRIETHPRHER